MEQSWRFAPYLHGISVFLVFRTQYVNRDRPECKILPYLQWADLLVKFLKILETKACKMGTPSFSRGIKMQVYCSSDMLKPPNSWVMMKLDYEWWQRSRSPIDFVMNFSFLTWIACLSFVVGGCCHCHRSLCSNNCYNRHETATQSSGHSCLS